MMIRYTLTYRAKSGTPVTLYNLGETGSRFIQGVQERLGSTEFQNIQQPHNYSQTELDALRKEQT